MLDIHPTSGIMFLLFLFEMRVSGNISITILLPKMLPASGVVSARSKCFHCLLLPLPSCRVWNQVQRQMSRQEVHCAVDVASYLQDPWTWLASECFHLKCPPAFSLALFCALFLVSPSGLFELIFILVLISSLYHVFIGKTCRYPISKMVLLSHFWLLRS